MSTIEKLYDFFNSVIPRELSCEWDNDGRMCIPNPEKNINKVLICLDVTNGVIDYAIQNNFDCIISHHPIIFDPVRNIDASNPLGKKICSLIKNDISVFSFHTRLDKVEGGVNDVLSELFGLQNVTSFSYVGRMGQVSPMSLVSFAENVKNKISADKVICVDGGKIVSKIAIVGGSGKGYLAEAKECGCDTFVTGELPFNYEHEARELGLNLVCGGHYFTENIVCARIEKLVKEFDAHIFTEIIESNPAFVI
ncbi:MAG: Nif3-like dinuclear metal center hexameric protein [Ruminococcaceae bacterium]|nr:Nif3-like dinuclear metal center hexameric protein [Oscillospiraceae bacterium]